MSKTNQRNLSERLRRFRAIKGLSQQDLANKLGVGKITVLRWENDTSNPSPLAAAKLEQIGFGDIDRSETKQVSIPRVALFQDHQDLRAAVREKIHIEDKDYIFDPTPYIINGPENQLAFFETLYRLQEITPLPCHASEYIRRLSLVATIPELGLTSAQYELERPKLKAKHWNPNYGPHGWHRYVGRFPPHLVRALLNHFGVKRGDIVCDPFAGSGTTLVESRLLGLKAIGIEICPLSCLISRTKSKFPISTSSLETVIEHLPTFYLEQWNDFVGEKNVKNIPHEEILARRGNSISPFPNYRRWLIPEALLGTSIILEFVGALTGFERDAVCCALSSRMRSIGNVDVDVVRAEYSKTPRIEVNVLKHVQSAIRKIIYDINQVASTHGDLLSTADDITVIEQSILDTDLPPASSDYIITSPPYGVESLSYLRTHLLSYRCLQPVLRYDPYGFNDKIIGSEYLKEHVTVNPCSLVSNLSQTYSKFFYNSLSPEDSTKAQHRKEMMMHFFNDMVEVAQRFSRWLRPGGRVAFMIGNKKIANQTIPTHIIISEIFSAFGLSLDQIVSHKLKCNNSNSEVPWQERTIQDEYVMLFTKKV